MRGDLTQQISGLKRENQKLNIRITELEGRLNKNSNNSSKPPLSDGLKKPKNSREKSGKSTGSQLGHKGTTLEKVGNPDEVIDIKPNQCQCGCDLSDVKSTISTRQVFEIPKIKIKTTEYRTHKVKCPICKRIHKTEFPKMVTQPVQYGENLQATMVYLTNYQLIPLEMAAEVIKSLTGQDISQGTVVNAGKHPNVGERERK